MSKQTLQLLSPQFTIHSLPCDHPIPSEVYQAEIFFIAKTQDELSIVCPYYINVDSQEQEPGWQALEVLGPLGFSLTGILSNISAVLAREKISIFAISTFDTDYILVKKTQVNNAMRALRKDGYAVLGDA